MKLFTKSLLKFILKIQFFLNTSMCKSRFSDGVLKLLNEKLFFKFDINKHVKNHILLAWLRDFIRFF